MNVCSTDQPAGYAHCDAHRRTDRRATSAHPARVSPAHTTVIGNNGAYDPPYLQSAYNAPSATGGAGQTVAIVDAYDDPNAETDLAVYRSHYGLPACTTANGCFTKVNQTRAARTLPGGRTPAGPRRSRSTSTWSARSARTATSCSSRPTEQLHRRPRHGGEHGRARSARTWSATATAAREYSGETTRRRRPTTTTPASRSRRAPATPATASSSRPPSPYVTAVGGTSLDQPTQHRPRDATETAWSGAGSGCSAYVAKPTWQTDTGCADAHGRRRLRRRRPEHRRLGLRHLRRRRVLAVFGGTSVVVADHRVDVRAGRQPGVDRHTRPSTRTRTTTALNDVTSGHQRHLRAGTYLCTGATGYDGPTGLGTPKSVLAFSPAGTILSGSPDAPTLAAVTSTTAVGGVDLSWNAPADNGSAITSYELYRAGASGGEKTLVSMRVHDGNLHLHRRHCRDRQEAASTSSRRSTRSAGGHARPSSESRSRSSRQEAKSRPSATHEGRRLTTQPWPAPRSCATRTSPIPWSASRTSSCRSRPISIEGGDTLARGNDPAVGGPTSSATRRPGRSSRSARPSQDRRVGRPGGHRRARRIARRAAGRCRRAFCWPVPDGLDIDVRGVRARSRSAPPTTASSSSAGSSRARPR